MKVLLLGEFSSVHRYLKQGLLEIGDIDVSLYGNGNGWKNIEGADGCLFTEGAKKLKKLYNNLIEPCVNAKKYRGYDVVQLINPQIFPLLSNLFILDKLERENNSISLLAVGGDYALTEAYKEGKFEYYAYDYEKRMINFYDSSKLRGKMNIYIDKKVVQMSDIIIPGSYEYTVGYENNVKLNKVIPFPINVKEIEYTENIVQGKIIFFHGINKELEKGTPFIRKALERLKQKYPNDVEIIMDGHMPFAKYIELMKKTNVVIDQCCAYGYGMNACIAMAQGKVVMSGNSTEARKSLGIDDVPIFHVRPDEEQIYDQLVYIVENKKLIPEWGYQSRKHIEDYHDYIRVAQQYLEAWRSTGKI